MFKTRLLSGILLVIIALVTVITGGNLLFAVLLLISLIGMTELYKVFHIEKKAPGIVGYIFAILYYGLLYFKPLLPGVFYVAVMLSYIYQIRIEVGGVFKVWLVFICAWGCDTCAYCVGMLIGKHKLAPILSPKKSIEGGIGGILGAALIGVLYGLAINYWGNAAADILEYAIIGAVGGAISQIGDLAASAIKRYHNIKDYGKLIPGHGGILDRFDSVIFTAPIIFYLSLFL